MKITSPIFTYEGGTKIKRAHGKGKISVDYSDKEFQKRAQKLPLNKGFFNYFNKQLFVEVDNCIFYELESIFKFNNPNLDFYKATYKHASGIIFQSFEKGMDPQQPPQRYKGDY